METSEVNISFSDFRKMHQGKYFRVITDHDYSYYYLKKVYEPYTTWDGFKGFLCVSDYLYIPKNRKPSFWENENLVISERKVGNTERISKSEYLSMLKKYGFERSKENVSRKIFREP